MYIFADDDVLPTYHAASRSRGPLLLALDALQQWSNKWLLLSLNIKKCQVVSYGRIIDKSVEYNITDENGQALALARSDRQLFWYKRNLCLAVQAKYILRLRIRRKTSILSNL